MDINGKLIIPKLRKAISWGMQSGGWGTCKIPIIPHTIHVYIYIWYIYLHLVDFYGECRNIYHTFMDAAMGTKQITMHFRDFSFSW